MRFIALIIFILIIPILYQVPNTGQNPVYESSIQAQNVYNFGNLPDGTIPQNNSWLGFSPIGNSSYLSYRIEKTGFGNALDIQTSSFEYSSYLRMDFHNFSGGMISLVFAWNSNVSASLTQDNIIASSNNTKLAGISFGPYIGYRTRIWNKTWSSYTGDEPGSDLYRLNMTFNSIYDMISFSISNLSSNNISIGTSLRPSSPYMKNLSVSFGGLLSNISIFSISEFPESAVFPSSFRQSALNSSSFAIPENDFPLRTDSRSSYYANLTNNFIYLSKNFNIVDFNTANRSFYILSNDSEYGILDYYGMFVVHNDLYFSFKTLSSILSLNVNLSSLKVTGFYSDIRMTAGQFMLSSGSYVAVTTDHGNTSIYSFSESSFVQKGASVPFLSEDTLIYAGFHNDSFVTVLLNLSNFQITEYCQYLNGSAMQFRSLGYLNLFSRNIDPEGYDSRNSNVTSLLKIDNSSEVAFFSPSQGFTVLPLLSGPDIRGNYSSSVPLVISGSSIISVRNSAVCSESTDLPVSSTVFGTFNQDTDSGIIISDNTIFTVYVGSFPLSSMPIKLSANSTYVLTSNITEKVNVSSAVAYTISVSFDNHTFASGDQNLSLDVYGIPEGKYCTELRAENVAGFSAYANTTIYVDDIPPVLNLSLKSGTYISNYTFIHYRMYDFFGIGSANVSFSNFSETLNAATGTFLVDLPGFNGTLHVNFTITDKLGVRFNYQYDFHVISIANATINITNGEIFNTSRISVAWSKLYQARYYSVSLYNGTEEIFNTCNTRMILNLGNGMWKIEVSAALPDNLSYTIFAGNITILDYRPSLAVRIPAFSEYSFFGNSMNDSLYVSLISNVSAMLSLEVFSPLGKELLLMDHDGSFNFTFSSYSMFSDSGIYAFRVRAVTVSGTSNSSSFEIDVNNSIPVMPFTNSTYYTNVSDLPISPMIQPYVRYLSTLVYDGNSVNTTEGIPMELCLSEGTGTYLLEVDATGPSGNHENSVVSIVYQNQTPKISFLVPSLNLVRTYTLRVNYTLTTEDPIHFLEISYGDHDQKFYNQNSSGEININFTSNGKYPVQIEVQDMCGNQATASIGNVSVQYYVSITGASIGTYWVIYGNYFTLKADGCVTNNLVVTWYIDGKYSGTGKSIYVRQPIGYNRVTAVLSYDGKSQAVNTTELNLGYIPILVLSAVSGIFLFLYEFTRCRDDDRISKFVLSNDMIDRRSLNKAARGERIPSRNLNRIIRELRDSGKIKIDMDPDSNSYIIVNKEEKS
ncbi:MAG: hypothetical protein ACP5NK_01030 [Thermoplasmata archaeon]